MAIEEFVRMFESKTKRSGEIFEEARILLPGGVSGSAAYMAPPPGVFRAGCRRQNCRCGWQ